jgi:hypothetical protein
MTKYAGGGGGGGVSVYQKNDAVLSKNASLYHTYFATLHRG